MAEGESIGKKFPLFRHCPGTVVTRQVLAHTVSVVISVKIGW